MFLSEFKYEFKRYWCKAGNNYFVDENGFLNNPQSQFIKENAELKTTLEIKDTKNLFLTGRRGIGKTFEQRRIYDNISTEKIWIDIEKENELNNFNSKLPLQLSTNKEDYFIFVDNIDDNCELRLNEIQNKASELSDHYNIYLRFISKGELSQGLINNKELVDKFDFYQLTPLSREDINHIVKDKFDQPDEFFKQLKDNFLIQFLSLPSVIDILIKEYKSAPFTPQNQYEIYEKILTFLAGSREDLLLASRIAAVTIFCNKEKISFEKAEDYSANLLTIDELLDTQFTKEEIEQLSIEVNNENTIRILNSSLFVRIDDNSYNWTHNSFRDFLAAWYLYKKKVNFDKLKNLLIVEVDKEYFVAPQLYEIASWLSLSSKETFDYILENDPLPLLKSKVLGFQPEKSKKLCEIILSKSDNITVNDAILGLRYRKLSFDKIEDFIRPLLKNPREEEKFIIAAIMIAWDLKLKPLQQDILSLLLDKNQTETVREISGQYIIHIADEQVKKHTRQLLDSEKYDDPNDKLKNIAFRALWPKHITVKEVFSLITEQNNPGFIGYYYLFLKEYFPRDIYNKFDTHEIDIGLSWCLKQTFDYKYPNVFSNIVDALIIKAWENLNELEDISKLSKIIIGRKTNYRPVIFNPRLLNEFRVDILKQDDKRRKLLSSIVHNFKNPSNDWRYIATSTQTQIASVKDVDWMVEQIDKETNQDIKSAWVNIIEWRLDKNNKDQRDLIINAWKNDNETYSKFIDIVPDELLDKETLVIKNEKHTRSQETKRHLSIPPIEIPSDEKIMQELITEIQNSETKNIMPFGQILTYFTSTNEAHNGEYADISQLNHWKNLDDKCKNYIVSSAEIYILNHNFDRKKILDLWENNKIASEFWVSFSAFSLLIKEKIEIIDNFGKEIWVKWAQLLTIYSLYYTFRNPNLVNLIYDNASIEFIDTLKLMIIKEDRTNIPLQFLNDIEDIIDNKIIEMLYSLLTSNELGASSERNILDILVSKEFSKAIGYAENLLVSIDRNQVYLKDKVIQAFVSLSINQKKIDWKILWTFIKQYPSIAKEAFLSLSYEIHNVDSQNTFQSKLDEFQLTCLVLWLFDNFPKENDVHRESMKVYKLTESDTIKEFRENTINYLLKLATLNSHKGLLIIQNYFPNYQFDFLVKQSIGMLARNQWIKKSYREVSSLLKMLLSDTLEIIVREMDNFTNEIREVKEKIQDESQRIIRILHLSDLHFTDDMNPNDLSSPIIRDLRTMNINSINYFIISGDIAFSGKRTQYIKAREFIQNILNALDIDNKNLLLTPGNHDVDWALPDQFKFDNYCHHLYYPLKTENYPLEYERQYVISPTPVKEDKIQFLLLNSAWDIDESHKDKSSIHQSALFNCLDKADIDSMLIKDQILRIAIFHHPINGNERINDDYFMEHFQQSNVRICLHGHTHDDNNFVYDYRNKNRIYVCGVGSFYSPPDQRAESTPCYYHLLEYTPDKKLVRIRTREKRRLNGIWSSAAIYRTDEPEKKVAYFDLELSN